MNDTRTSLSTANLSENGAIAITAIYTLILITGILGNVATCLVIGRNKSMHTSTNYYLFSLSMSDMLLLVVGLPQELHSLWNPEVYLFGDAVCILQGFLSETASNATVVTIAAFTIERYIAICHPFISHQTATLSRARRYILFIWMAALVLAIPQASQLGIERKLQQGDESRTCTVVGKSFQHAFEISTFLFFVGPITLITVLYVLIGLQLRKNKRLVATNSGGSHEGRVDARVVRMLVVVVLAFFLCWAPFHCQRLLAVYLASIDEEIPENSYIRFGYMILMYSSGILYYLSTTINPLLYHTMSNKFRKAFKKTILEMCSSKRELERRHTYSILKFTQLSGIYSSDNSKRTSIGAHDNYMRKSIRIYTDPK